MEQGSIVFLGEKKLSCRMVMIVSDQLIGMIQRWLIEKKQTALNVNFCSYPLNDLKQERHYVTFLPLGQKLSYYGFNRQKVLVISFIIFEIIIPKNKILSVLST